MILQWLASPEWANLIKALLHTLWQGAVIAVLLGFALRRLDNPTIRYRSSLAALGGVLLAGLVTWAVLNRPLPRVVSAEPVSASTSQKVAPLPANDLPPLVVNFSEPEPKPAPLPWSSWLALLWLAGATVMIFRGGFQVAGAERLRRSSRPLADARIAGLLEDARQAVGLARRVRLVATDKLTSPAVVGVLVPTLILPLSLTTTLTPEQIRFVLLHELAHIRRGDYFASLFQLFAEALLFFNPAVWWISRQMRIEREACCDALAIELSGAPVDYAKTLLCVAENVLQPMPAAAPAFGDRREPASLADRVQRMLVPGYRPRLRLTWRAMLLALCIGGGLLFLSALGTSVTVAAILSPQQRIERIEKKMTELGEKPEPEFFSDNGENAPQVKISGQVRTADGSPVPKWVWLNINSSVKHSSYGTAIPAQNGFFTNSIRAGNILIGAEVTDFAPAFIGPLNGFATNRFANLEILLQRGFDVPLQLVDAENSQPLAQARVTTMFWMSNNGFQAHTWESGADGSITLKHCADMPLDVTVNSPGYGITRKRFEHLRAGEPLRMELRRGASESGMVLDKFTGQPVSGAEVHLLYQKDFGRFQWDDSFYLLGKTAASGAFTLNQLRPGIQYYLGVSAAGHASVILDHVPGGKNDLTIQLGPELIVRGHVTGSLEGLQVIDHDYCLDRNFSDVFGNNSCGFQEWVRLRVTNGVTTFQFTNRSAGPVTLTSQTGYREEREVTAPIDDWVVDLTNIKKTEAVSLPKREVIFRFKNSSGVPPCGTVQVTIPDNLDIKHLTAHSQEFEITNGEVHAQIAVGGRTSIEPKHMVGYWFNRTGNWKSPTGESGDWLSIEVHSNASPLVIDIPLIPAGAIYASAKNADGTAAGGLFFGVSELKRAPGRDQNSLDNSGDSLDGNAPRQWVSGPLPLGGTYQIYGWRGNSFCVSQPIKLTEARPDAEVELQFPPGKIFNGVVLDADGKPLRDAELKVSFSLPDNHGFGLKSVFTDERGRFQLENLTPDLGEYTMETDAPGLMAERVTLKIVAQPQTIRLRRGHTLAGHVVEAGTSSVIPGAEVRVWTDGKQPAQTTHTDADGHFEFTTLGDATYTIFVEDGQSVSNQKYHADGSTNLTVAVKLYAWSKVKPKTEVAPTAGRVVKMATSKVDINRITMADMSEPLPKYNNGSNPPTVLIEARLCQMSDTDFHNFSSGLPFNPARADRDAWWSVAPEKLPPLLKKLEASGLPLIQRPRIQTSHGKAAAFFVGTATNGVEIDCLPLVADKTIDLVFKSEAFNTGLGGFTNRFNARVSVPSHGGMLWRIENYEGKAGNNLAMFVSAEVLSDKAWVRPRSATNNLFYTGPGRQAIVAKLDHIRLDNVSFDSLPLKEVLKQLAEQVRLHDPENKGVNFLINSDSRQPAAVGAAPQLDPTTGLPIAPNAGTEPADLGSVFIKIPSLKEARLADVLDAIVLAADHPIKYSIQDFAVVFSRKVPETPQLFMRTFRVDAHAMISGMKAVDPNLASLTDPTVIVRRFITNLGVNLELPAGKLVRFYSDFSNEHSGSLFVKATEADLDTIERAIQVLNTVPLQIHIKARFYEAPKGTLLGFQNFAMASNSAAQITGILNATNAQAVMRLLQARSDIEVLAEPEVTTVSGRQTQMRATDVVTVVTNMVFQDTVTNQDGTVVTNAIVPQTSKIETGPILDVVPYVLSDGYTINLALIPSLTEFRGYDKSTNTTAAYNRAGEKIDVPGVLPRFTVRRVVTTINLWDNQTAILADLPEATYIAGSPVNEKSKTSDKELLIFITATIVDPAGNRVHADDELPFAQKGIPVQPQTNESFPR